jgi:hypothetical protein
LPATKSCYDTSRCFLRAPVRNHAEEFTDFRLNGSLREVVIHTISLELSPPGVTKSCGSQKCTGCYTCSSFCGRRTLKCADLYYSTGQLLPAEADGEPLAQHRITVLQLIQTDRDQITSQRLYTGPAQIHYV